MNALVDKAKHIATMTFDLNDIDDKEVFIMYLKQLQPRRLEDQMQIDRTIVAAGGQPETVFPGYEFMQQ